jgi:hypothetical protein
VTPSCEELLNNIIITPEADFFAALLGYFALLLLAWKGVECW